jgi:hypothetical protein
LRPSFPTSFHSAAVDSPNEGKEENEEHAPFFLADPYALPPTPEGEPSLRTPRLALFSVLAALLLGPVGAVLGIVLGWQARRKLEGSEGRRPVGHWLATAGLALGVLMTLAWGFVGAYVFITDRHRADPQPPEATLREPREPLPRPGTSASPSDATPTWMPPRMTHVETVGTIRVVDIGLSVSSLANELAQQRAQATKAGETLMVMTTAVTCDPCRGVDGALRDPRMKAALARVRLARVDRDAFEEDLDRLHIPTDRFPGFFLLSPDLTPNDGVDGGEWDEDVAANIAPVLGAFARGTYRVRRQRFHTVPSFGITL